MRERPQNMSVCPRDGEPLVGSFEVPKTEWLCMVCGIRLPMFSAPTSAPTDELWARFEELRQRYRNGERPDATAGS